MTGGSLFLYLTVIAVTSFVGGTIPLLRNWSHRSLLLPVSFSGGILLGAAFFHMIPESTQLLGRAVGWPLLAGFLVIFCLERFVLVHPNPEGASEHGLAHHIHLGIAAYIGISFHSLLDGLAVTSAYERPDLAGVVLLAVIFHKMPDAFALATLLLLDRWSKPAIALLMVLFAFTTPLGAVLTWLFLRRATNTIVGGALALSAGTFLAVATSDILPQIRRFDNQRVLPFLALFVGLAFSWLGVLID
jgi:zinc and cadmium transporter